MEEEGCSSILQYLFFAHIEYAVEGDCCTQKISCAGLRQCAICIRKRTRSYDEF